MSFYNWVRREFGYSIRGDYVSALLLNMKLKVDLEKDLMDMLDGANVAVVGAGPSIVKVKELNEDVIIAADGATNYLVENFIVPDVVVTDLDGITSYPRSLYVVHAHGDNLQHHWKTDLMGRFIVTAQVSPFGGVKLYGGFTDGDRAYLIAKIFNARKIKLYGMDFDSDYIGRYSKPHYKADVPMTYVKRKKLNLAKEIIHTLNRKDL
ncbi:MAG: 6-hydroxymethylpterin diphosphokinase MptE-like protein [Metallosphaera sp.]|uniref:6-hydroxymethylpterin diphosphokinase MptE-like protein n=1 Tax=Metallosphaera sp. TaxID=2020860 RepID=UPI0031603A8B